MKYSILLLLIFLFFVGCGSDVGKPCLQREIPEAKKEAAAKYVQGLMSTIQVTTRNDDEDWDDFIEAAHSSAERIFSEELKGEYIEAAGGYYECDCSKARAKAQLTTSTGSH